MNYKVGDVVTVKPGRGFSPWWPFRRFWMPHSGFGYGQAKGTGTVVEVIPPSQKGGIANAGGYRVQLRNGTFHYYSEAELRLAPDDKRQGG